MQETQRKMLPYVVRQIYANIYEDRAFLVISLKLGRIIEHDHKSHFINGATSNLTFGDL